MPAITLPETRIDPLVRHNALHMCCGRARRVSGENTSGRRAAFACQATRESDAALRAVPCLGASQLHDSLHEKERAVGGARISSAAPARVTTENRSRPSRNRARAVLICCRARSFFEYACSAKAHLLPHNALHMCCGRGGGASAAAQQAPSTGRARGAPRPAADGTMCLLCVSTGRNAAFARWSSAFLTVFRRRRHLVAAFALPIDILVFACIGRGRNPPSGGVEDHGVA